MLVLGGAPRLTALYSIPGTESSVAAYEYVSSFVIPEPYRRIFKLT